MKVVSRCAVVAKSSEIVEDPIAEGSAAVVKVVGPMAASAS